MSAKEIGSQFVNHYYNTFDNNRAQLANLYVRIHFLFLEYIELWTCVATGVDHDVGRKWVKWSTSYYAKTRFVAYDEAYGNDDGRASYFEQRNDRLRYWQIIGKKDCVCFVVLFL